MSETRDTTGTPYFVDELNEKDVEIASLRTQLQQAETALKAIDKGVGPRPDGTNGLSTWQLQEIARAYFRALAAPPADPKEGEH